MLDQSAVQRRLEAALLGDAASARRRCWSRFDGDLHVGGEHLDRPHRYRRSLPSSAVSPVAGPCRYLLAQVTFPISAACHLYAEPGRPAVSLWPWLRVVRIGLGYGAADPVRGCRAGAGAVPIATTIVGDLCSVAGRALIQGWSGPVGVRSGTSVPRSAPCSSSTSVGRWSFGSICRSASATVVMFTRFSRNTSDRTAVA